MDCVMTTVIASRPPILLHWRGFIRAMSYNIGDFPTNTCLEA